MNVIQKAKETTRQINEIAKAEGKSTGFCIGNTVKLNSNNIYFMPIRNTAVMITGGAIVYSEKQAFDIAQAIDGKVKYVLVDAEKKISNSKDGVLSNVERTVRETITSSSLWVYKGNDLSVEAVDGFLTQAMKHDIRGIGGKKVAILGAGNIGTKLALKLVERGAHVVITRRNKEILESITNALNFIKPVYTKELVEGTIDNEEAVIGADILIGTTPGVPVITADMVCRLSDKPIIIDVGKGSLFPDAIKEAEKLKIDIYRLDVSAAFEGMIHKLWCLENTFAKKMGRRFFCGESLVSGGFMGRNNEIVVDDVHNPTILYGIANGNGDFVRELSEKQLERLKEFSNSALNKGRRDHLI